MVEGTAGEEESDSEATESDADTRRAATGVPNVDADVAAARVETSADESLKSAAEIGAAVVTKITAVIPDAPSSPV